MSEPSAYQHLKSIVQIQLPHLNEQDFSFFEENGEIITLEKNETWELEGKVSQYMAFVHTGLMRQFGINDGNEFTVDFFKEGEFAGNYISFQNNLPSELITQALEKTELIVLSFKRFLELVEMLPDLQAFSDMVGNQKLLKMHRRNNTLLKNSPEERYDLFVEDHQDLIHRIPQYIIAQYLGILPESLSRIRKRRM